MGDFYNLSELEQESDRIVNATEELKVKEVLVVKGRRNKGRRGCSDLGRQGCKCEQYQNASLFYSGCLLFCSTIIICRLFLLHCFSYEL